MKTKQSFSHQKKINFDPISLHNQRFNRFNNKQTPIEYYYNNIKLNKSNNYNNHCNSFTFSTINNNIKINNNNTNLSSLNNDPIIQNIKKLKNKISIVNSDNFKKNKKRIVDIFNYNKVKWEKKHLKNNEKIIMNLKSYDNKRNEWMKKIATSVEFKLKNNLGKRGSIIDIKYNSIDATPKLSSNRL